MKLEELLSKAEPGIPKGVFSFVQFGQQKKTQMVIFENLLFFYCPDRPGKFLPAETA